MGQCISRQTGLGESCDNNRSPTIAFIEGSKKVINKRRSKLTQSSFKIKGSSDSAEVEPSKSTDSSESNNSKPRRRGSNAGVVIIPEATEHTQNSEGSFLLLNNGIDKIYSRSQNNDLTSPTVTATTVCSTPAFSVLSEGGMTNDFDTPSNAEYWPKSDEQVSVLTFSTPSIEEISGSTADGSHTMSETQTPLVSTEKALIINEITTESVVPKSLSRKNRLKSSITKDCQHPRSGQVEDTVSASFTPIKQTSLQSKVSVIREEEVLEAPSDEEALHDKTISRRMQRELNLKTRVSGPLTPVKLRTQWKTTPSSIQVREPAIWLKGSSLTSSPLRDGINPPSSNGNSAPDDLNKSVNDCILSNFQKLKLQVAVAEQEEKRNHKVTKMEDRIKDVQGYRELWGEFQQIQKQITEVETSKSNKCEKDLHDPVETALQNGVEYDFEDDDLAVLTGRKRRSAHKPKKSSLSRSKLPPEPSHPGVSSQSVSFDQKDTSTWIFDFEAEGFDTKACCDDDDSSQASLSLLSEKSMEAQRRLFAQKRKQRKRKKKLQKQGEGAQVVVDGTPLVRNSSSSKAANDDEISRASSYSDYGPTHRLRRSSRSVDRYMKEGYIESSSSVITDMEVAFHITSSVNKSTTGDNDNCSMVSDLADDLSYSASVTSSYSRDNASVCSGSNDYRVTKRRQRNYSHQPVDLEKFVISSNCSTGNNSMCSVVERRKAIEARLQMLNKRQQMSGPADPIDSVLTSQLTKKFDEAAIACETTDPASSWKPANQPKPARVSVDPPEDFVVGHGSEHPQCGSSKHPEELFRSPGFGNEANTRLRASPGKSNVECIQGKSLGLAPNRLPSQEGLKKLEVDHALSYMTTEAFIRMSSKNAFEDKLHWTNMPETSTINVAHFKQYIESPDQMVPTKENSPSTRVSDLPNDENVLSQQFSGCDAAKKSLELADEVATQVKDVLDRFRSPNLKTDC